MQDYRDRLKWDIPGARITKAENDRFIQEGFVYAFEAISRMIALTPLSETSLGWLFQVALFTKPYATVERLGDRILNGQGRLIIPMEAKQGQFQMIVDKRQRRLILTQTGSRTVISMDKHYERAEPFDISFDQISQVGQSVKYGTNVFNESVPKDAPRMFEMRPANAVFTETPFLIHFGAMYGELAVRQIVWNFGKFLTHVIDHPQLRSELIKQNAGGGWNFATGILLAAAAGASSATGNAVQAAVIMNSLDRFETETQSEKLQQQQQLQAWESLAADTSFDLIQKDLFRSFDGELEKLH